MRGEGPALAPPRLGACTASVIENPRAYALFLDIDGTLLELAPTPKSVRVPEGLSDLLERLLVRFEGAVAVISGRLISESDKILSPSKLAASGVHGAELRRAPDSEIERVSPSIPEALASQLKALAEGIPGVLAEPKGPGFAIHYRLAPAAEPDVFAALGLLLEPYTGAFEILPGKRLYEIVPSGLSKGTAIAALSALPAFRGRAPIMIGDDIGDEPAFSVAEGMHGYALRVAGEHYGSGIADFSGPLAVLAWLEEIAGRMQIPQAARSA